MTHTTPSRGNPPTPSGRSEGQPSRDRDQPGPKGLGLEEAAEPRVLHVVLYALKESEPNGGVSLVERGGVLHAVPAVLEMVAVREHGGNGRSGVLIYLQDVAGLRAYSVDPVHHQYALEWFLPATTNVQVGDFIVDGPPPESFGAVEAFMARPVGDVSARARLEHALQSVRTLPGVIAVQSGYAVESTPAGSLGGVIFFSSLEAAEAARGHVEYVRWLETTRAFPASALLFGSAWRVPPFAVSANNAG